MVLTTQKPTVRSAIIEILVCLNLTSPEEGLVGVVTEIVGKVKDGLPPDIQHILDNLKNECLVSDDISPRAVIDFWDRKRRELREE